MYTMALVVGRTFMPVLIAFNVNHLYSLPPQFVCYSRDARGKIYHLRSNIEHQKESFCI